MTPDFLLQLLSMVAVGGGVYGAIRADLARVHEKAINAERSANRAHERIDEFHNHWKATS